MESFGSAGGFDHILARIKGPLSTLPPDTELVFACVGLVSAPYNVYHRCFVRDFVEPFVTVILDYMTNIPEDDMKNVRKERLETTLFQIEHLIRRVYTVRQSVEETIKLRVRIGLRLLRSELLERRIHAIRLISDTCRTAKFSQSFSSQTQSHEIVLVNKVLQVPQIIEQIFGKWSHIELIQRSTEILNFFLLFNSLTRAELEVIWGCCLRDEQSKVEIYKVINDAQACASKETVMAFLVEKFAALPPSQLRSIDLSLLFEFEHRFAHLPPEVLKQILELMWSVNIRKAEYNSVSTEMREKSLEKYCEILSSIYYVPEELTHEYFARIYKMLSEVLLSSHGFD